MRQAYKRGVPTAYRSPPKPQPDYHTEIDPEYLDALQRQVDRNKQEGFKLTPISQPGW